MMERKRWHLVLDAILVVSVFLLARWFILESDDCYFSFWQFESWGDFWLTRPNTDGVKLVGIPQNGRYLGNVLGVVLAKLYDSPLFVLRILFFGGGFLLLSVGSGLSFGGPKRRYECATVTLALLLLAPRGLWQEVYSWGAAYANYVTPMVALVFLPILAAKAAETHRARYGVGLLLVGLSACLFMEPVTIFLVLASLLALMWALAFRRTWIRPCGILLLASGLGAALMFQSPGYQAVGSDGLREMGLDLIGENVAAIFVGTLLRPAVLTLIVTGLLLWHLHQGRSKGFFPCLLMAIPIHGLSLAAGCLDLADPGKTVLLPPPQVPEVVISVLLAVLWLTMLVLWRGGAAKQRVVSLVVALCLFSGPLLVIAINGYRNFFSSYVVLTLVALVLYDAAREKGMRAAAWPKALAVLAVLALLSVYHQNWRVYQYRLELARSQVELGAEKIVLPLLPYPGFARNEQPDKGDISYQVYQETPWDVAFRFLPYAQWREEIGFDSSSSAPEFP